MDKMDKKIVNKITSEFIVENGLELEIKHCYTYGRRGHTTYSLDGKLHRVDGPAMITYYEHGVIESETWYKNGIIHRENNPAVIEYKGNKLVKSEVWFFDGAVTRYDGPAVIKYKNDEIISSERWVVCDIDINNPPDHWPLSKEEAVEFKLRYG